MARDMTKRSTVLLSTAAVLALGGAAQVAGPAGASQQHAVPGQTSGLFPTKIPGQTSGLLPTKKVILKSTVEVNLSNHSATLPLHEGEFHGETVWYVITEASDEGAARDLNVNFAPKLANVGIGCDVCVQDVTLTAPASNKFGEAVAHFEGVPDFSPNRVLKAGPTVFPPAVAQPGGVGDAKYSPFIQAKGSKTVYNAPIVATGTGDFDVVHHSNTADRVLKINPAKKAGPGQFYAPSVELLIINGFDSGQPILYLSTEASDAATATLERATFVPLLGKTPFTGGDDFLGSTRERIFPFVNGQTGLNNPEAQGLIHLIKDGYASEDAYLGNKDLIQSMRRGGDSLNVQGDFPTLTDPHRKFAYSPLWEAQFSQWTDKAIRLGRNTRQTDEFQILNLAARRPDLLTGPEGVPFGSTNILINCPVIAFTAMQPVEEVVEPIPGAQVETMGSFQALSHSGSDTSPPVGPVDAGGGGTAAGTAPRTAGDDREAAVPAASNGPLPMLPISLGVLGLGLGAFVLATLRRGRVRVDR